MIIRFLGETVKRYLEEFEKGFKGLNKQCPICNGNCNRHGTYQRYINEDERFLLIPIQRLKCKRCNKTHAIIPHIVRPYSPYQQNIREEVMDFVRLGVPKAQIARKYGIHRELIRFWVKGFKTRAPEICTGIQAGLPQIKEIHTESYWCYLRGLVRAVMQPGTNILGLANCIANFSGLRVWV